MPAFKISFFASIIAFVFALFSRQIEVWKAQVWPWDLGATGTVKDPLATPAYMPFWTLETIALAGASLMLVVALLLLILGCVLNVRDGWRLRAGLMLIFGVLAVLLIWLIQFLGYVLPLEQLPQWLRQAHGI